MPSLAAGHRPAVDQWPSSQAEPPAPAGLSNAIGLPGRAHPDADLFLVSRFVAEEFDELLSGMARRRQTDLQGRY